MPQLAHFVARPRGFLTLSLGWCDVESVLETMLRIVMCTVITLFVANKV
jgi:hypothetical protein